MRGNRSLDEFAQQPAVEEPEPAGEEAAPASPDDDAVPDPPSSTYVFRPGGAPCAVCGEPAEERWRADGGLVCAGCKEW